MKAISRLSICLMLMIGMFSAIGNAQVLYGTLTGSVTDASGSVVPGAQVTALNTQTGIQSTTESNAAGTYTFNNIQPGNYNVTVTSQGFRSVSAEGVTVVINAVRRQNFELQIGQVTEQVTVEASAVSLQTEKTDVSASISTQEITTLPLPAFRNFQSLVDLVPGTTPARFQNATVDTPARAMTTNVNGTARNMNTMRVDGAVNVFVWLPHHAAYVPPVETVETVNVSTNNFDAEQGLAGGAAVTVATKSGTNEFHGVGFHFHDNQTLYARNTFLRPEQRQPVAISNIFGGTFGGAIIKNKLFFFGGYEGNVRREGANLLLNVATPDMRAGNFSNLAGTTFGTTIFDPASGLADGTGRTAFANNIVPQGRIDPISVRAQNLVPNANTPGLTQNFAIGGNQAFNRHNYDFKTDYNVSDAVRLWGKYSRMDALVSAPPAFGQGIGPGVGGAPGTGDTTVQLVTVGTSATLSPTMLFDANFGWTGMDQSVTSVDYGNFVGQELGIPGTNDQLGNDIRYSGTPAFGVDGFTAWGLTAGWMPLFRNDHSFASNANLGILKGNHNIRMGFDVVKFHLNHWQPEIANPRGSFNFGQGLTAQLNIDPNTGARQVSPTTPANSYAGYLLGLQSDNGKSLQYDEMTGREWQTGLYIRDTWQATRNLTLTLGLRYEFFPLITRRDTGIEYFNTANNTVERGGVGGVPRDLGIGVQRGLFAPRIGMAYKLSTKNVIRAGYGITYNPIPLSRPLRGFYPLTIAQAILPDDPIVGIGALSGGIPVFDGPDRNQGIVDMPLNVTTRGIWAPGGERELRRGYIQSWNFIVERELRQGLVGNIGYIGTKTVRGFGDWNARHSAPGTGVQGIPMFQEFGRNASTLLWNGWLDTQYHGFQASLNGRIGRGAVIRTAYTWSKAMNWTDDDGWAGLGWNSPEMWDRNWARGGFDRTHNFQIGGSWDLPFGRGRQFATDGVAAAVLGGWQINGTIAMFSGTPFTVGASGASVNSVGNGQTADQVKPEVATPKGIGRGFEWFDRSAYTQILDTRFGNTHRNSLRGPGVFNSNGSIFRNFALTEKFQLQFRTEFFNVTNTPIFNNPVANVNSGDFGFVTATNGGYGSPAERNIRFGLRLSF